MVDGVYHQIYAEWLRPGDRENDLVGEVSGSRTHMGSDEVEAVNAVSGERCSPHPHVFADRLIRPGDTAYFDINPCLQRLSNLLLPHLQRRHARPTSQRDAYRLCREWLDRAIELIKPGVTRPTRSRASWPKARGLRLRRTSWLRSACSSATGSGLRCTSDRSSHASCPSIIRWRSRKGSGVRTRNLACPAKDGYSAARIEEEIVVTNEGRRRDLAVPGGRLADQR